MTDRTEIEMLLDRMTVRTRVLEDFVRAYDTVEAGLVDFELFAYAVARLERAREAIYWVKLPGTEQSGAVSGIENHRSQFSAGDPDAVPVDGA